MAGSPGFAVTDQLNIYICAGDYPAAKWHLLLKQIHSQCGEMASIYHSPSQNCWPDWSLYIFFFEGHIVVAYLQEKTPHNTWLDHDLCISINIMAYRFMMIHVFQSTNITDHHGLSGAPGSDVFPFRVPVSGSRFSAPATPVAVLGCDSFSAAWASEAAGDAACAGRALLAVV